MRSVLVVAQSLFVCFVHDTRVCCIEVESLLPVEFGRSVFFVLNMSRWTRLHHDRTDCDRALRSVTRIVNCWIIEQFSRVRESSRVRVHQHASSFTSDTTSKIQKMVAGQGSQCTECLGRMDKNLPVRIHLTCRCQEQQLAAVESSRHQNR